MTKGVEQVLQEGGEVGDVGNLEWLSSQRST
jgi:hypothetical protein